MTAIANIQPKMGNTCGVSSNTSDNTCSAKSFHDLVEALDREWRELMRAHHGTVSRWADRHEALAPYRSLEEVLSVARRHSDPILSALLI